MFEIKSLRSMIDVIRSVRNRNELSLKMSVKTDSMQSYYERSGIV